MSHLRISQVIVKTWTKKKLYVFDNDWSPITTHWLSWGQGRLSFSCLALSDLCNLEGLCLSFIMIQQLYLLKYPNLDSAGVTIANKMVENPAKMLFSSPYLVCPFFHSCLLSINWIFQQILLTIESWAKPYTRQENNPGILSHYPL